MRSADNAIADAQAGVLGPGQRVPRAGPCCASPRGERREGKVVLAKAGAKSTRFMKCFMAKLHLEAWCLARIIRCDGLNMRSGGGAGDTGEGSGMEWVAWTQQAASVSPFIVFLELLLLLFVVVVVLEASKTQPKDAPKLFVSYLLSV